MCGTSGRPGTLGATIFGVRLTVKGVDPMLFSKIKMFGNFIELVQFTGTGESFVAMFFVEISKEMFFISARCSCM